ncbi:hypothetical protein GIB67_003876 [Kingdonia uniflora]|uniref:EF-hand domain-containing protein n=1 Tax=Kingdonia uniflora TaxID=39325 RepID=A0A7J7LK62_9MAGN|nr:hypothetical protein GIB67_003876 [Kingdonia uniflora]
MASCTGMKVKKSEVLDGSEIMELVENKQVFSNFIDHKFSELDTNRDGKLSVNELQPAVADIGAALGLPPQGISPDTDHIYSEVLNQFTHGKHDHVSKTEFKVVLSDILLGMAAGLKRDPIVILRMDGEDLLEFINSTRFEAEMVPLFTHIDSAGGTLRDYIIKALMQLTVDNGMPPSSDLWVVSNIIEPMLHSCAVADGRDQTGISAEIFLEEFKKFLERVAEKLREQPVIVAHSENTFEGTGVRRFLSNKFEVDKVLNAAMTDIPKDRHGKFSKEYLRVALDFIAPSAGLPPYGAVDQMSKVVNEVFKMVNAEDGKLVEQEEFKKLILEILGSLMLQLEGNPISVSSNSVVHEPLNSSSSLLATPS